MLLGMGLAISVFAQDASPPVPAGISMRQAGQDIKEAAKNAYVGTVRVLDDTTITTQVKDAFASGKGINSSDIHVTTTAGIVTLDGQVRNAGTAARVEAIARNTRGVRGVTNDLRVRSSEN
jgi:osmotically-inducible protein OsmY